MEWKKVAGAVIGASMAVIGTAAEAATIACSANGDDGSSCQQAQELSTACSAQDVIEESERK